MLGIDIASAIVQAVNMLINQHRIDRYARLTFSMVFSGVVSYLFIAGGTLGATASYARSTGAGMVAAAVSMTVVFRRSELSKGMVVALPQGEADAEMNADVQVISRT